MTNMKEGADAREIKIPDGFDVEQVLKHFQCSKLFLQLSLGFEVYII